MTLTDTILMDIIPSGTIHTVMATATIHTAGTMAGRVPGTLTTTRPQDLVLIMVAQGHQNMDVVEAEALSMDALL